MTACMTTKSRRTLSCSHTVISNDSDLGSDLCAFRVQFETLGLNGNEIFGVETKETKVMDWVSVDGFKLDRFVV